MDRERRFRLEREIQQRVGYVSGIAGIDDETLLSLLGDDADLSILDRPSMPRIICDERPLHEQILGFRLW